MTFFANLLSALFEKSDTKYTPVRLANDTIEEMAIQLVKATDETQGFEIARTILEGFGALSDAEKIDFFKFMAHSMDINPETVRKTLEQYERNPSKATYRSFVSATEPNRQELIRRLNQIPNATSALVSMRSDLLRLKKADASLEALDLDFRHLFASWFNRGFLVLKPINWQTPANILEKIIEYEAVHAIDSWDDLRRRLQPSDRRCYAFFHPSIPEDPLIFVEVALTKGVPNSVQELLAEERSAATPDEIDTAVFYSISNCQAGLASISFGNSLIKQVVATLKNEQAGLKTFVTLSPIPLLSKWALEQGHKIDETQSHNVKELASFYLLEAKGARGLPYDPVARFHLGNGAKIYAVHAEADISDNGKTQSGGAMVNYLYDLETVAANHEQFATNKIIAVTSEVSQLSANFKNQNPT